MLKGLSAASEFLLIRMVHQITKQAVVGGVVPGSEGVRQTNLQTDIEKQECGDDSCRYIQKHYYGAGKQHQFPWNPWDAEPNDKYQRYTQRQIQQR